jgi:hypothetical protein
MASKLCVAQASACVIFFDEFATAHRLKFVLRDQKSILQIQLLGRRRAIGRGGSGQGEIVNVIALEVRPFTGGARVNTVTCAVPTEE